MDSKLDSARNLPTSSAPIQIIINWLKILLVRTVGENRARNSDICAFSSVCLIINVKQIILIEK